MTSQAHSPDTGPCKNRSRLYTYDELSSLKEEVCWMVYQNSVYDLKAFIPHHPGGDILIRHLLYSDISDHMSKFHPPYVAGERLPRFYLGEIEPSTFPPQFLRSRTQASVDFRQMEQRMAQEGLFEPCYAYYVRELLKFLMLFAGAIWIVVSGTQSVAMVAFAAFLHGFSNQQMAFLIHDASHNAITQIRKWDHILSTIMTNVFGGISIGLWKAEHLTHHVVTNDCSHDPDIQFIPFIAISTGFFSGVYSSFHERRLSFGSFARTMVKIQHIIGYVYVPLFKFALYLAAPLFVIFSPRAQKGAAKELILMAIYYVWLSYFLSFLPSWSLRVLYFFLSNVITSLVFLQIVLAHMAMPTPRYEEDGKVEFFRYELYTTLDVSCNPWWDWFHGGLNFQVIHHLWPRMARPNLRRSQEFVKQFCKEHDIDYKIVSLWECLTMIISHFRDVANSVDTHFAKEEKLKEQ